MFKLLQDSSFFSKSEVDKSMPIPSNFLVLFLQYFSSIILDNVLNKKSTEEINNQQQIVYNSFECFVDSYPKQKGSFIFSCLVQDCKAMGEKALDTAISKDLNFSENSLIQSQPVNIAAFCLVLKNPLPSKIPKTAVNEILTTIIKKKNQKIEFEIEEQKFVADVYTDLKPTAAHSSNFDEEKLFVNNLVEITLIQ